MKKKINISIASIAIIAVVITLIGITIVYYNLYQQQVKSGLIVNAKLLKDTKYFEVVNIDKDVIDLSTDLKELRVSWIDKEGKVLYDNDTSSELLTNHIDRPEIIEAFAKGEGEAVRKSDTMNKDTFYYAVLLDNGTVLRVSTSARSLWSIFLSAVPIIVPIVLLIIAICVLISHLLTKKLLAPVEMMAKDLENADYDVPYKELEPLAKTLRAQHTDIIAAAKVRQDFTANVSHELKTPLTAISGYAQLLEGDMVEQDKMKYFYSEIRKNADRLLVLINDIIRLSELDRKSYTPSFEVVDLYDVANECMEVLMINAKQREVNISIEGESVEIYANRDMIKELIENLSQNAIRYNNPGGDVLITITTKEGKANLIVEDNGIGIPDADISRVFERFYRVDKSRSKATGGTGLGLAIVKHIIEIHDAQISLESKLGEGTIVKVVF